jgi:hypothetical protein
MTAFGGGVSTGLSSLRNSVGSRFYPGLTPGAKICRPCGAGILAARGIMQAQDGIRVQCRPEGLLHPFCRSVGFADLFSQFFQLRGSLRVGVPGKKLLHGVKFSGGQIPLISLLIQLG